MHEYFSFYYFHLINIPELHNNISSAARVVMLTHHTIRPKTAEMWSGMSGELPYSSPRARETDVSPMGGGPPHQSGGTYPIPTL